MKKVIVILLATCFVLSAGLANASPKQAGLSNVGSVLIFPKIDTTATEVNPLGQETFIMLSNNNNLPVQIHCEWVVVGPAIEPYPACDRDGDDFKPALPPSQTRSDFMFVLTPFQPIIFAASSGLGIDPTITTASPFGENKGYLMCWAVDLATGQNQISFNHLSGSAIVAGANTGYQYPAWAAQALGPFNTPVGCCPGLIKFDAVDYDALPSYLLFEFPTLGTPAPFTGLFFQDLDLTLIQGKQNLLTLSSDHYVTGAVFDTWNENETRYSGASRCVWCFSEDFLDSVKVAGTSFFTDTHLLSFVAKFRVTGKDAAGCAPNLSQDEADSCFGVGTHFFHQASPLLGLAVQYLGVAPVEPGITTAYATTNLPVGVAQDFTGFIQWK